VSWALSRPARSSRGAYYEVASSPRGDIQLWYPGYAPRSPGNITPGILGLLSLIVNKVAFRGRWRVVVRQATDGQGVNPTHGVLWHKDVRKREVEPLMQELVSRIEAGSFAPECAIDGVV